MPYANAYNANVSSQVLALHQQHINRENQINDYSSNYEIPSQVEHMTMHQAAVHGGSGYAAATVQDLGFEPTLGATGDGRPKRGRKKEIAVGEGLSAAGFTGAGPGEPTCLSANGMSGGAKRPRGSRTKKGGDFNDVINTIGNVAESAGKVARTVAPYVAPLLMAAGERKKGSRSKKGGALIGLQDMYAMEGDPGPMMNAKVTVQAKPDVGHAPQQDIGTGGGMTAAGRNREHRNTIVREVMKKHGLSLPQASKFVKDHKLY